MATIEQIILDKISIKNVKILQNLIEAFDQNSKYPEPTDFSGWEKLQTELDFSKATLNEKSKLIGQYKKDGKDVSELMKEIESIKDKMISS